MNLNENEKNCDEIDEVEINSFVVVGPNWRYGDVLHLWNDYVQMAVPSSMSVERVHFAHTFEDRMLEHEPRNKLKNFHFKFRFESQSKSFTKFEKKKSHPLTSSHDSSSWSTFRVGAGNSISIGFGAALWLTTLYRYWSNDARDGHVSIWACRKLANQNSHQTINEIISSNKFCEKWFYRLFFGTQMVRDIEWTFFQFQVRMIAHTLDQMRLKTRLQNHVCFVIRAHDRLIVTRNIHGNVQNWLSLAKKFSWNGPPIVEIFNFFFIFFFEHSRSHFYVNCTTHWRYC